MGMSGCCKCCIGCGICAAVLAAIMIPVGMLVIAPAIGQSAVNGATLYIHSVVDMVQNPLPEPVEGPTSARINNSIIAHNKLPLPADLGESEMYMILPAIGDADNATDQCVSLFGMPPCVEGILATFTQPKAHLGKGNTTIPTYSKTLNVPNGQNLVIFTFALAGNGWVRVNILGKPTLTALGFVKMNVKLGKQLNCSLAFENYEEEAEFRQAAEDFEQFEVYMARRMEGRRLQGTQYMSPVPMDCTQIGNVDPDYSHEWDLLDNNTADNNTVSV